MKKNPNKTAGNWGALKTKPQNLVPFQVGGKVRVTAGGEKHVIYKKTTKRGEGKVGDIMVNHPTTDKGVWDTIDLTKKAGAKTIKQGVASTKKWHKENPYNDMKKQLTKKYQNGGNTAADKVAEQRAINAKRKAEALARTEKAKTDARAKIDQAQKNKPVTKPAEPVAQTTAPVRRNPENDWLAITAGKAKIATKRDPYNYENKAITKNKMNVLGRNVRKTKADSYFVPGKMVTLDENDSEEMFRRKMGYLSDKSDQQKTGTQKTRTVTNPKKGTVKTVTRSKGSYLKDGEKKRTVTKTSMKTGGSIKKYQTGGSSYIDKVKGTAAGIKANTKKKPTTTQGYRNYIAAAERSLLTPGRVDYLGDNRKQFPVKDAVRIAVGKGELKKKFTRASTPSDVLLNSAATRNTPSNLNKTTPSSFTPPKASSPKMVKQSLYKPLYKNNKKTGGTIKKKK
jgi:hypothetical protein